MKLQTAKGVQDTPPEEKIVKEKVVETLKKVFELYGFAPLETPILERHETLAAKFAAGEASDALNEIFKLKDQGKRELALRFDLTVPLARYIAMNPTLKMPFKRYEIGPVFRDGPIKAGRVRQFWQCDIDTIGSSSMLSDAEVIAVLQTVFNKLKLDAVIKVNNRKLLNGILEQAKVARKEEAIIAIDKLDKIGVKGVTEELKARGYQNKQIASIFSLVKEGINLKQLKSKITVNEGKEGIAELEELFSCLTMMGVNKAVFDVSLARGLAYYTGTVFEVYAKEGKITSSLAAGGRWDQMIGKFLESNREVPAVGVAFGLVPIIECMKEKKQWKEKTPAQVYVIPIKTVKESLNIVRQLREAGINVDFDLNNRGVSKNLEYASALEIPYTVIVGENELKQNKVMFRNMDSGEQQLLTIKNVIEKCKKNK